MEYILIHQSLFVRSNRSDELSVVNCIPRLAAENKILYFVWFFPSWVLMLFYEINVLEAAMHTCSNDLGHLTLIWAAQFWSQ